MDRDLLEKEIEEQVCRYARSYDFIAYKFTSPAQRSVPDRIFISPQGKLIFIEFKRAGKTTTKAQQHEIQRLADHGQAVYVVDDVDSGKALVDAFRPASVSVVDS